MAARFASYYGLCWLLPTCSRASGDLPW